jgi:aldehyde dehydrogenase (NAD+)
MTIAGAPVAAQSGCTFKVLNPATEQPVADVPDCSRMQLDEAVRAARSAFPAWAQTPIAERRARLMALAERMRGSVGSLRHLLTLEQGKCYAEAEKEILAAANAVSLMAALELPVDVAEDSAGRKIETRRVPIGVVAAIAPWNFPIMLAAIKLAPALLAGNTVILKPSPYTPLTTLHLGDLARDLFPAGVLNVICGSDRLGPWITEHSGVDKIAFTGSTQTGRRIMQSAGANLKRLTLELGGNDPAIVLDDVNVEEVAENLFWSAFRNAGQVCVATKRMYIHERIYGALTQALVRVGRAVKVGNGTLEGVQMGPVSNRAQYDRLKALLADARERGCRFLLGDESARSPGYFLPITLIDNPPEDARIVQEEQFGPVLPLLKFSRIEEAIARCNASEYGLGASVWSADSARARELAHSLQAGLIWINETPSMHPLAAFGGHKQSGIGAEGGLEGLLAYTLTQTCFVRKH